MMATVEAIRVGYLDKLYQHDANLITTPMRKPEQEKWIISTKYHQTSMNFLFFAAPQSARCAFINLKVHHRSNSDIYLQ